MENDWKQDSWKLIWSDLKAKSAPGNKEAKWEWAHSAGRNITEPFQKKEKKKILETVVSLHRL